MLSMPADLLNKNLWSLLLNFLLPLQLCLTPRVLLSTLERISLSTERTSIRKLKLLFMIGITNTLKIMVSKLVKSFTESLLVTSTVSKLIKSLLIFSLESLEVSKKLVELNKKILPNVLVTPLLLLVISLEQLKILKHKNQRRFLKDWSSLDKDLNFFLKRSLLAEQLKSNILT